jgi:hypothetical protein
MYLYYVGVYTPNGRTVIEINADSRTQACNIVWGKGYTVVDCNHHNHD